MAGRAEDYDSPDSASEGEEGSPAQKLAAAERRAKAEAEALAEAEAQVWCGFVAQCLLLAGHGVRGSMTARLRFRPLQGYTAVYWKRPIGTITFSLDTSFVMAARKAMLRCQCVSAVRVCLCSQLRPAHARFQQKDGYVSDDTSYPLPPGTASTQGIQGTLQAAVLRAVDVAAL